ncbi:MAG: 4Fe-4S dicluster domain-containing protein [Thermodesulfobacteriota bacterium]|nr:4Fe-4S dicluster domain-containing protein [Thermodesulfobacteriota bacterium]
MKEKKISEDKLPELLKTLKDKFLVLVPEENDGVIEFKALGDTYAPLPGFSNSTRPVRTLFHLTYEPMFQFANSEEGFSLEEIQPEEVKRVIFGVRPCDANALGIIDNLFKDTYEDSYYLKRRENTYIIGLGCDTHDDACFCTSLDVSPVFSQNVDLMFNLIDGTFIIKSNTEKGEELLLSLSDLAEAKDEELQKLNEKEEKIKESISRNVNLENIDSRMRANFENSSFWQKVSGKCIGCGICTYNCPTCHCFDIIDEESKEGKGARFRCYDSCAFPLFTKMPMENPRHYKWERVRQKVHHKFEYFPLNFGVIACVGCGRCIRQCPVNWDITEVINEISKPDNKG